MTSKKESVQKASRSNILRHILFFKGTSVLITIFDKRLTYAHRLRKYFSIAYIYSTTKKCRDLGIIEYEKHGTVNLLKFTPEGLDFAKSLKEVDMLLSKIEDEYQKNIINRKHNI